MHRLDDDVFEPSPTLSTSGCRSSQLLPLAGLNERWSARGVIGALEPLTTPDRCQRLRRTLDQRISSVTVVFDHPHDPHNGSAVLRSCDAFGVQQMHVVSSQEAFTASRTVAKGSDRWVDVVHHDDPKTATEHLRSRGFRLVVTHPEGHLTPGDLPRLGRIALVLGNERDGVSDALTRLSDESVRIPMRGFVESLNVSVTAAILLQAACEGKSGDLNPLERENIYARWLRKSVPRADEVLAALDPC